MQVNFFGTDDDIAQLWRWLFEVPEMVVLEPYSQPDASNRVFDTWEAIEASLADKSTSLAAWPRSVGGEPRWEEARMDRAKPWHLRGKVRTILRSPALIGVEKNNDQAGCLAVSYLTCWNEHGARQRSMYPDEFLDSVDWKKFRSIFGKVRRHLLRGAAAQLSTAPVMSDAFAKLQLGEIKLWNFGGGEVTMSHPDLTMV